MLEAVDAIKSYYRARDEMICKSDWEKTTETISSLDTNKFQNWIVVKIFDVEEVHYRHSDEWLQWMIKIMGGD